MAKSVRYKDKNTTIVYSKGMSRDDIISVIQKRIDERNKKIDQRQFIVDEYNRLKEANKIDYDWLEYIKGHEEFLSSN